MEVFQVFRRRLASRLAFLAVGPGGLQRRFLEFALDVLAVDFDFSDVVRVQLSAEEIVADRRPLGARVRKNQHP